MHVFGYVVFLHLWTFENVKSKHNYPCCINNKIHNLLEFMFHMNFKCDLMGIYVVTLNLMFSFYVMYGIN